MRDISLGRFTEYVVCESVAKDLDCSGEKQSATQLGRVIGG